MHDLAHIGIGQRSERLAIAAGYHAEDATLLIS